MSVSHEMSGSIRTKYHNHDILTSESVSPKKWDRQVNETT
jgi:hypothetical protein